MLNRMPRLTEIMHEQGIMRTAEAYRPTRFDRLILFGKRIVESYRINKTVVIFICVDVSRWRLDAGIRRRQEKRHVVLKFYFSGHIQYHRIEHGEIEKYISYLHNAKCKLEEMEA